MNASAKPAFPDDIHQPAPGQAKAWLRLLLAMTVPVLWLLAGITLSR